MFVLTGILRDGVDRGVLTPNDRLPRAVRADLERIAAVPGLDGIPAAVAQPWHDRLGSAVRVAELRAVRGRLTNGVTDFPAYFDHQLKAMAGYLELG